MTDLTKRPAEKKSLAQQVREQRDKLFAIQLAEQGAVIHRPRSWLRWSREQQQGWSRQNG